MPERKGKERELYRSCESDSPLAEHRQLPLVPSSYLRFSHLHSSRPFLPHVEAVQPVLSIFTTTPQGVERGPADRYPPQPWLEPGLARNGAAYRSDLTKGTAKGSAFVQAGEPDDCREVSWESSAGRVQTPWDAGYGGK